MRRHVTRGTARRRERTNSYRTLEGKPVVIDDLKDPDRNERKMLQQVV